MLSIRARLSIYAGLAFAGLVLVVLVTRPAPDALDNPAYDSLVRAHSRRMAADALALDSARAALSTSSAKVSTTIVRYKTVRDSLVITDTVRVKEFVQKADSVVRACTALVESCAVFRVRAESSLAGLTVDRDLWKGIAESQKPSRWAGLKEWGLRLSIGYLAFKVGQAAR